MQAGINEELTLVNAIFHQMYSEANKELASFVQLHEPEKRRSLYFITPSNVKSPLPAI